jgi:hypothetical protein
MTDATNKRFMTDAQETKLDSVESGADVTDTANVTSAGALMDSEVTNLAQVKAFDSSDYATAAQGSTADSAMQDLVDDTTPQLGGDLDANGNAMVAADHGTASTDEVVNVCYGTSATPPTASTTTEGTLYIQYTA